MGKSFIITGTLKPQNSENILRALAVVFPSVQLKYRIFGFDINYKDELTAINVQTLGSKTECFLHFEYKGDEASLNKIINILCLEFKKADVRYWITYNQIGIDGNVVGNDVDFMDPLFNSLMS